MSLWWMIPILLLLYAFLTVVYLPFTTSPPHIKQMALKFATYAFWMSIGSGLVLGIVALVT